MATTPMPKTYHTVIRDLLRRVRALEVSRPLSSASVGALTLGDGTGTTPSGITASRASGAMSFEASDTRVQVFDGSGDPILSDHPVLLHGAGRPSLAYPMLPVDTSRDVTTSSAAFVDVAECEFRMVNAAVEGRVQVACSDGTTEAEVQLTDGAGVPLDGSTGAQSPVAVPAGTTVMTRTVTEACIPPAAAVHDPVVVRLQVRVTAGAGSVTVRPGVFCGA